MAVEAEKMREKQREQRERIKAEQVSGMMGTQYCSKSVPTFGIIFSTKSLVIRFLIQKHSQNSKQ